MLFFGMPILRVDGMVLMSSLPGRMSPARARYNIIPAARESLSANHGHGYYIFVVERPTAWITELFLHTRKRPQHDVNET